MSAVPRRVLVVDDEESMRFFLRRALSRRGFAVETAPDGPEGIAAFRARRPDAVLLDVRLPGMGGREVLEVLRRESATTPVIMMTGYATVDDAMGAMWSGATDYVRKPLRADDVAGALERALAAPPGTAAPPTVRALAGRSGPAEPPAAVPEERPEVAPADPVAWLRAEAAVRRLPLPPDSGQAPTLHEAVRLFEAVFADELLRRSRGNVARAARAAGVTRPNFHRKCRSLGIDAERYRGGDA